MNKSAIALLSTGDEIVIGDIVNTNAQQIAHALHAERILIGLHMTCGDKDEELDDSLEFLTQKHDTLIITGGLGPTSDDRTRYALARWMQTNLVLFSNALDHIQTRLRHNPSALTSGNQQQALFPAKAILFPNPNGTAMGCYCHHKNKLLILLPGPPRECLPMFNDYVLPLLQHHYHTSQELLKWRVFGVAEAQIAQMVDDALADIDCVTGYRLDTPYVECKVSCDKEQVDNIKKIIDPLLSPYIITKTDKKASQLLSDLITEKKITVSIQDNVTGGLLQCLIQKPNNHAWLTFGSRHGQELHFEIDGLEEYWKQDESTKTSLKIRYFENGNSDEETKELPYRSSLVVHIAAEWLSFRLFHLINQLHQ